MSKKPKHFYERGPLRMPLRNCSRCENRPKAAARRMRQAPLRST